MNRFTTTTRKDLSQEDLYVVILGGSLGYREKNKGTKILQNFEGSPVLTKQISTIRHAYPNSIISVTVGFEADKVIRQRPQDITLIENQLWETTNTVEEIRLYLNSVVANRVLFIEGAMVFSKPAIEITSAPSIHYNCHDGDEVGVQVSDGEVIHFSYGLDQKWSSILYLEGKSLDTYRKICTRENNKLCMFETINSLLERGIKLNAHTSKKSDIVRI